MSKRTFAAMGTIAVMAVAQASVRQQPATGTCRLFGYTKECIEGMTQLDCNYRGIIRGLVSSWDKTKSACP